MSEIVPPPAFDRVAKRQMLMIMNALWRAVLIGNAPPSTQALYARMKDPRPGDLVVESSTMYLLRDDLTDSRWDGQFVTYRETITEVVSDTDEPDNRAYDRVETYLVCLNPDGTEFRWWNAGLLAVPDGTSDWADS